MKKLFSLAALAVMFVACGSDTPKVDDTPDIVVKKCLQASADGDAKQVAKCNYYKTEDEKQRALKQIINEVDKSKEFIDKKGGIKSIKTSIINELESVAKVKVAVEFKNDESFDRTFDLTKIDGTWYMDEKF